MNLRLDHVMIGVPDLDDGIDWFRTATGVHPTKGGAHPQLGTHNALASLGADSYLEIIAIDPTNPVSNELTIRLAAVADPIPIGWCLSCEDAGATARTLEQAGIESTVATVGRASPDGSELRWQVVMLRHDLGPAIPFLIDWGTTPSPARTAPTGCALLEVMPTHPQPHAAQALLDTLGICTTVAEGTRSGLRLRLGTECGNVLEVGR